MKEGYPSYPKGTQFIEDYLDSIEKKRLRDFLTFCGQSANDNKVKARKYELLVCRDILEKEFDNWTLEDIRGFLAMMKRANLSDWTKKCIITTLKMFLRFNWKDWSLRFENFEDFHRFNKGLHLSTEQKYDKDKQITAEEADRMIRACDKYRDKAYLALAFEAGLPPAVELNLRWEDIKFDVEEGITRIDYFRNKNKDSFSVPVKMATKYLKDWKQHYNYPNLRKDDLVFPSTKRDRPISNNSMWVMIKANAKKAGIEKNVYQYLLRHGRLSESYEKLPEEVHRKLYGHRRGSQMTKIYSHVEKDKAFKEGLLRLHSVKELTQEEKNKYEIELAELRKQIDEIKNMKLASFTKLIKREISNLSTKSRVSGDVG